MTLLLKIVKKDNRYHLIKILEKKFACSVTFTFLDADHVRLEVRCLTEDANTIQDALKGLD